MLKTTVAILAVVLAGTANASGWRNLRIDASSEASFSESVATFQDKLTPSRRIAFARSLQDIWLQGTKVAGEQQREYTDADYLRQLHGLGYEEVVKLTDPTGKKEGRYRAEYYYSRGGRGFDSTAAGLSWSTAYPPPVQNGQYRGERGVPNTADSRAACGCMFPGNAPSSN
jgi:hypothetical protein